MPDPSPPADSPVRASALDTSVIPLGERALQGILDHVMAVGDEAETTCLEVKGPLDMGSKTSTAKIAKFLLGAANRGPREAARHFHGYAVLVIGAQKEDAPGVPRGTEAHELEDRLRPYLGPQFPAFEFGRIEVGSDHEVLFVIAQPPEDGQPIFPCHKSYQSDDRRDSLEDGAIYVRGNSNTRPARSGEILALVERARGGGKPPIVLEVELVGYVHRVDRVEEVLEQLLNYREEQFHKEPEQQEQTSFSPASLQLASNLFGSAKPPSREDRDKALAAWRRKKAEYIAGGREHLLGVGLSGAGIRVLSRDRFIAKPRLTLTFHGCELFDHLDADDADFEKAAEPVLRRQNPLGPGFDYAALRPLPKDYPVNWSNRSEDAEIVLTPESLRPNDPWTSDQDDYVIVARDTGACSAKVTWLLTEEGNDVVTTGEFVVPTEELIDASDVLKSVFFDGV
ncbi:MAG: hypothetical protein L0G94_11450 [Brachybacterium sp.]|uniref:hypothetical protein n=1 Tax=Brachybacterium sp. TaxID=1891286 RepID=UPI002647875C|nr:hypothetical protein [Brachybacterium sp.]MDN5687271.1 hypothetical protein [Brachybacterium sp.]